MYLIWFHFNTFYLTDSYISFTLKMESVTKSTILEDIFITEFAILGTFMK